MEQGLLPREKKIHIEHSLVISHILKIINLKNRLTENK